MSADFTHSTSGDVPRLFIGRQMRLVLAGIAVGAFAALILTRMLSSLSHLLYGIGPSDPVTFGAVSLVMIFVVALACYIPAHRAVKVDPVVALRSE
jgi:putative ABC transport system permease protein